MSGSIIGRTKCYPTQATKNDFIGEKYTVTPPSTLSTPDDNPAKQHRPASSTLFTAIRRRQQTKPKNIHTDTHRHRQAHTHTHGKNRIACVFASYVAKLNGRWVSSLHGGVSCPAYFPSCLGRRLPKPHSTFYCRSSGFKDRYSSISVRWIFPPQEEEKNRRTPSYKAYTVTVGRRKKR